MAGLHQAGASGVMLWWVLLPYCTPAMLLLALAAVLPRKEAPPDCHRSTTNRSQPLRFSLPISSLQVFGREQIGVMFYLMRRATSGISMAIEKIEVLPGSSSSSSKHGETYQLRIVGRHSFYFPPIIRWGCSSCSSSSSAAQKCCGHGSCLCNPLLVHSNQ